MHLCIDLQASLCNVKVLAGHAVDKLQIACECMPVCGASREAAARERLAMLKSNDVGAYLKLVQSAKNSRLSQLLNQTDACLNKLAARLNLRSSVHGSRVASAQTAGTDGKETTSLAALSVGEVIKLAPATDLHAQCKLAC